MRYTMTIALLAALALMLLSGCPRDEVGDTAAAISPPTSTDTSSDSAHGEPAPADTSDGAPVATDEAAGDDTADSELAADTDKMDTADEELGEEMSTEETNENTVQVVFETTKGEIVMEVHPDWAPLGAAHFIELVEAGFYDGAPWFRVIPGFMAQCGIAAGPEMNAEWGEKTIMDEPVKQGNQPGFVAFGKSQMPNSRSTHIFINYVDNSRSLDPQGFSCFARVIEGFDTVGELYPCEYGDQGGLASPGGLDRFKAAYADADYITRAYVK